MNAQIWIENKKLKIMNSSTQFFEGDRGVASSTSKTLKSLDQKYCIIGQNVKSHELKCNYCN